MFYKLKSLLLRLSPALPLSFASYPPLTPPTARRSRSRSRPTSSNVNPTSKSISKPPLPPYVPFRPPLPIQLLNDFLHWSPIADAIVYTLFWSLFTLLSAVVTPVYLILVRLPLIIIEQIYRNVKSITTIKCHQDQPEHGENAQLERTCT